MLTKLKLLIKLTVLQFKIRHYTKRYNVSRKKTDRLSDKLYKIKNDYYYSREHLHPEDTWEMRAEREFNRLNL